jgi:Protein of unknown function (DUF2283)
MIQDRCWRAGYVYLLPEPRPQIARTVTVSEDVLIDVAADGRLVGVEWLWDGDWATGLVQAALQGRLRLT